MFEGFGASGVVLVRPWRAGNAFWMRLRVAEVRLGGVLGHLGASWEDPGGVLASLGNFLGAFWEFFFEFLCHPEQYAEIAQNLEKTLGFH